jgi:hypothetical protein
VLEHIFADERLDKGRNKEKILTLKNMISERFSSCTARVLQVFLISIQGLKSSENPTHYIRLYFREDFDIFESLESHKS